MDSMLYWLPGVSGVHTSNRRAVLEPLGLLGVLDGTSPNCREAMAGPDGKTGCVMAARNAHTQDARVSYVPGEQTWRKCMGGAFWVGYWNDGKPGPEALCRREVVNGYEVTLCDGNKWMIPLVRQISGGTLLPRSIGYDENGSMILDIQPKFSAFYVMGARVWDSLVEHDRYAETLEEVVDIAVTALGVNYHLGKWEIGAIGLFDSRNALDVVDAIVDGPMVRKWSAEKKTVLNGTGDDSNAGDGCAES